MRSIGERKNSIYRINQIRNRLHDDISRYIFDARIKYMIYKNDEDFCETINSRYEYNVNEVPVIASLLNQFQNFENIVIYGAGHNGIATMSMLNRSNFTRKRYFCDIDKRKIGHIICGAEVLSIDELIEKKNESIVVITVENVCKDIYNYLIAKGFSDRQIVIPDGNQFIVYFDNQYFDFFDADSHEVFVDGGAYDGASSVDFVKWTKGNFDGIYIYEANPKNESMIRAKLADNGVDKYTLLGCGLWSKKDMFYFCDENGRGAAISDGGNKKILVDSIDNTVKGPVSLIKLDIEGSEYEAIIGAKNTVRKYKPRMAISIYHKLEDVVEIPSLILSLNPNYRFAMRHYSSGFFETVLYAWIER